MLCSIRQGRKQSTIYLVALSLGIIFHSSAEADWKTDWEKAIAVAKREGQLNFYVGRYGTEPLLDEFRREYPEVKIRRCSKST